MFLYCSIVGYLTGKKKLALIGFNQWKYTIVNNYFDERYILCPRLIYDKFPYLVRLLTKGIVCWGCKYDYKDSLSIAIKEEVEDGFLRSVGLGVEKVMPMSLIVDGSSIHFDRNRVSTIKAMAYRRQQLGEELLRRSERCIAFIKNYDIDKYNISRSPSLIELSKSEEYVLVLGQVDSDASIRYACEVPITSNQLVYLAKMRHPFSKIIYRPHPEVVRELQTDQESFKNLKRICILDDSGSSLTELLRADEIKKVYTISSLSGMESLFYNKEVYVYGSPFYSGWGLTNDFNTPFIKSVKLSELFYYSYIDYPIYICPFTNDRITVEETLIIIVLIKNSMVYKDIDGFTIKNTLFAKELLNSFESEWLVNSSLLKHIREI